MGFLVKRFMAAVALLIVCSSAMAADFGVSRSSAESFDGSVTVSWPTQKDRFANSTSFTLSLEWVDAQENVISVSLPQLATSHTLTALPAGFNQITVIYNGHFGGRSGGSLTGSTDHLVIDERPKNFSFSTIPDTSTGSFTASWAADYVETFEYQYRKESAANWTSNSTINTSQTITLSETAIFALRVRACNPFGCSAYSDSQTIAIVRKPPQPTQLLIDKSNEPFVTLSWNSSSNANFYQVEYRRLGESAFKPFTESAKVLGTSVGASVTSGTYDFRVRSCAELRGFAQCSSWRNLSSQIIGGGQASSTLQSAPAEFKYDLNNVGVAGWFTESQFVAITQGSYSVNQGVMSYSVPIKLPPAVNDLAPSLALAYNSGSNRSGLVGVGWGISGLSLISRCSKVFAVEGAEAQKSNPRYTNADRLCLDGRKLVLREGANDASDHTYWNSSSVYSPEIDDLTKIIHNPNGNGFIAYSKGGLKFYYGIGEREDIHYRAGHYGSDIARWALSKVEDRYGNSYRYHYIYDHNTYEHNISWIQLNPNASVVFDYVERGKDYSTGLDAGTRFIKTQLLDTITTYINTSGQKISNNPVSQYRINYVSSPVTDRLLIDEISECGFDNVFGGWMCAEPLSFEWSEPEVGFESEFTSRPFCQGELTIENAGCMLRPEVHNLLVMGKSYYNPVFTADGVGKLYMPPIAPPSNGVYEAFVYYDPPAVQGGSRVQVLKAKGDYLWVTPNPPSLVLADFNNDGLTDFSFDGYIWLQDRNKVGGHPFVKQAVKSDVVDAPGAVAFDKNYDNLPDVLSLQGVDGTHLEGTLSQFPLLSNGFYYGNVEETDSGIKFTTVDGKLPAPAELFFGDYDGDGRLEQPRHDEASKNIVQPGLPGIHVVDINRDGLDDIITRENFQIAKVTETGEIDFSITRRSLAIPREEPPRWSDGTYNWAKDFYSLWLEIKDIDGDGYSDFVWRDENYLLAKRGQPDMLIRVSNGFGAVTEFEYSELVNEENFGELLYKTDFKNSSYPYKTLDRSKQVLKKLSSSNGIGGKNHIYYNYEGGRIDVRGRGFTGFEKITVTSDAAEQRITSEYEIDWPFTGKLKRISVESISGSKISNSQYFYKTHPSNPRLVINDYETMETFALLSEPVSAKQVNYRYDEYGNLIERATFNAASLLNGKADSNWTLAILEQFGYSNDEQSWLIGVKDFEQTIFVDSGMQDIRAASSSFIAEPNTKDIKTTKRFSGKAFESTTTIVRNSQGIVTSTTTSAVDNFSEPSTERQSSLHDFEDIIYPTRAKNALGHESFMGYDKRFGKVNYARDPNGLESFKTFDALGRAIEEVGPTGAVTRQINYYCDFAPVSCPELAVYLTATITSHPEEGSKLASPLTIQYYDSVQRVIQTETFLIDGSSVKQDTHYDSKGRLHRVSEPYTLFPMYYTEYGNYNALGEAQLIQVPDGGELEIERWQEGELQVTQKSVTVANTNSNNGLQITQTYTNSLGQVVKVIDAENIEIAYTYDSQGNLATTMVANDLASKVTITHDEAGNKTRIQDPAAGVIDYNYNGFGELRVQTWAKGTADAKRIETDYDKLGRELRRDEYKGDVRESSTGSLYDDEFVGAMHAQIKSGSSLFITASTINELGQIEEYGDYVDGWRHVQHTYDKFGRIETSTYPDGTKIKLVYHAAGFHVQTLDITNGERLLWALGDETDERGSYRYQLYGNNVITEQAVLPENGSLNRIVSGKVTNGSMASFKGTLQNYTYDWDSIGNLQSRNSRRVNSSGSVIENVTERFEYDSLNRLDFAETFGQSIVPRTRDYQYDDFGNLTHNGRSSQQYARTNGASLYGVTRANNKDYRYDVFGNVKQRGSTTIDYDVFNKPTRIGDTHFYYGTSRQKVKQVTGSKTTQYFFGGQFEVEKNGTTTTTTLRIGNYVKKVSGSTVTEEFHLYDHLGSTDVITNAVGTMVQRMAFDAFGNRLESHFAANDSTASGSSNYKGYTGHDMLDNLGLIHMGGRVYDPDVGRFLSADLFVHSAYDTQSYNRYSYVRNNPFRATDPSGYSESEFLSGLANDSHYAMKIGYRWSGPSERDASQAILGSFDGVLSNAYHMENTQALDDLVEKVFERNQEEREGRVTMVECLPGEEGADSNGGKGTDLDDAQKGDPDNGGFSPVSGLYGTDSGAVVDLTVGESGLLMDAGGTAYTFGGNGVVSPLFSGEATSICPSCYAIGAGGLLRGAFTSAKGFLVGGLTVRAPFAIPVQRFGVMSTVSADYWGLRIGSSVFANRTFAAIKPAWNPLTTYTTGVIPRGTQITFGLIGPQGFRYPGGSMQFIVNSRNVASQSTQLVR